MSQSPSWFNFKKKWQNIFYRWFKLAKCGFSCCCFPYFWQWLNVLFYIRVWLTVREQCLILAVQTEIKHSFVVHKLFKHYLCAIMPMYSVCVICVYLDVFTCASSHTLILVSIHIFPLSLTTAELPGSFTPKSLLVFATVDQLIVSPSVCHESSDLALTSA